MKQRATVPVWVDLNNSDGKLRAATLGTGRIVLREESDAVVLPARCSFNPLPALPWFLFATGITSCPQKRRRFTSARL